MRPVALNELIIPRFPARARASKYPLRSVGTTAREGDRRRGSRHGGRRGRRRPQRMRECLRDSAQRIVDAAAAAAAATVANISMPKIMHVNHACLPTASSPASHLPTAA
jgi:hypothetical protein